MHRALAEDIEEVYLAKLSEQADRFDDMVNYMKKVVEMKAGELLMEERNILSVAFKNVVSKVRASLRTIKAREDEEIEKGSTKSNLVTNYRKSVQKQLQDMCSSIISLLDGSLIAKAENHEARIFYQKMKADYYRYRSEYAEGSDKESFKLAAKSSYEEADENATKNLPTTHPIRLGLALNHTVFMYEVEGKKEEACAFAKKAFDEAISELDSLDEDTYKDCTLIMQLLRDNLTLWNSGD
mmetsp:Transcript_54276/g.140148  ORF Transcript_54276/g.140148 Transcript_54276/m.140148 type:complete len:240 (-) Transcript_54276:313-1032(-)